MFYEAVIERRLVKWERSVQLALLKGHKCHFSRIRLHSKTLGTSETGDGFKWKPNNRKAQDEFER
jgi:hypothetical protein